jgi:hypothetical protein
MPCDPGKRADLLFDNGVRAEFGEPTAASAEDKPCSGAASDLSGCARGTAVSIANAIR